MECLGVEDDTPMALGLYSIPLITMSCYRDFSRLISNTKLQNGSSIIAVGTSFFNGDIFHIGQ